MAMIDSSNIIAYSSRSRRVQQNSSRNYDGEGERNLELGGIFEVLGAYKDYEGGINCSKCGKLYKSKVCFIKHLWEHSVYWDLFPGDKNHERVLAIQAALILYSHYLGVSQEDANRLRELLVTSPNSHEAQSGMSCQQSTPLLPRNQPATFSQRSVNDLSPINSGIGNQMSHMSGTVNTSTSSSQLLVNQSMGYRVDPRYPTTPLRDLSLAVSPETPPPTSGPSTLSSGNPGTRRALVMEPYPQTPPKALEPFLQCPATPRKDKRKAVAAKLQRTARRKRRLLLE